MPAKKEENKQVNVMLSSLEYKALAIMGGATSVLKGRIELEAGDKFKLLMMKQRKLDLIVQIQQEIADIDALIKDSDRKAAEEEKRKQEDPKKKNETLTIKKQEPGLMFWNVNCPNCSVSQKMQRSASVRRCSGCGQMIKRDAWLKTENPGRSPSEERKE